MMLRSKQRPPGKDYVDTETAIEMCRAVPSEIRAGDVRIDVDPKRTMPRPGSSDADLFFTFEAAPSGADD